MTIATSTLGTAELIQENGKLFLRVIPTNWVTGYNNIKVSMVIDPLQMAFFDIALVGGGSFAAATSIKSIQNLTHVDVSVSANNGETSGVLDIALRPNTEGGAMAVEITELTVNGETSTEPMLTNLDVEDGIAPTVTTASMADNPATDLLFTFSEAIQFGSGKATLMTAAGELVQEFDAQDGAGMTLSEKSLILNPDLDLAYGLPYELAFQAGMLRDLAGNNFAGRSYTFSFSDSPNVKTGNGEANLFYSNANSERIDGGDGTDTVVFAGLKADYVFGTTSDGKRTLSSGIDGKLQTDTLHNIERLQFADTALAYDTDGHAGQAYRLYQAAFDRTPDIPGLGWWIKYLDNGMSLTEVAGYFVNSEEFTAAYGSLTNSAFISQLYQNVLHRAAEPAGQDYWTGLLDKSSMTRPEVLYYFSESAENQAQVLGAIQNGMEYQFFF